jgi:hypothetical protein
MPVSARSTERAWPRVVAKTGLKPQALLSDDYMVQVGKKYWRLLPPAATGLPPSTPLKQMH